MRNLHDPIRKKITEEIIQALKTLGLDLLPSPIEVFNQLVEPPPAAGADLAYGCFIAAKSLKKSPAIVAQDLKRVLEDQGLLQAGIEALLPAGPYLNFRISVELIGEKLIQPILSGDYFQTPLTTSNQKTMIEYSQPNTHKELHVGHMRNACLGDALVRMSRYTGQNVISATFPGDVGTHVAKCLWYLKYRNAEPIPEKNKGEWLGQIYSKANLQLEDELGSEKEADNREKLTTILKQLESKQGEFFDLWKQTRLWSIDLMKSVYQWAGIEFDQWYWESDVDSASVEFVNKLYADGKLVKSEGAVGFDLESDNLGFCLLLKSDGTGLYATKDLELARRKFQDFKIDRSIYVVDVRQELHFKQVFKVLEKLGFEQAKDCFHLKYNFVELPDGAMSSRKGNIIPLMELVSKMQSTVKADYLSRYKDEWAKEEIDRIADEVAKGAIKYGMLRMDTNKKIVFDMKEWLKLDGESGPFIQYSTARIQSLVRKFSDDDQAHHSLEWKLLTHPTERQLMQSLLQFHQTVLISTESYKPHLMCTYLYDLSKRFNQFYHECSIGQAESEQLKKTRLALARSTGLVLMKGLSLLGIPSPEKM